MLEVLSSASIVRSLETGTMRVVGTFQLNGPERVAVAEFLTGRRYDPAWTAQAAKRCAEPSWNVEEAFTRPHWNGWGNGAANTRFQSRDRAGLDAAGVQRLKLKWAFAFPGETIAESQPTVVGGRLFVGSRSGAVYSLDAETACTHWTFQADGPVKNSVLLGYSGTGEARRLLAFFGDLGGWVYAVDAKTGAEVWRKRPDDHVASRIMGSFLLAENQLLIPLTSVESTLAAAQDAVCCEFRGSVVSLDPMTGEENWKRYTIAETPTKQGINANGIDMLGPSGATIWTTPTYDALLKRVYVGTGENYSNPPTDTSDSILAVDLETTEVVWKYQGLSGDAWNMSCGTENPVNCPENTGPDYDMGSSPSISTLADGRRVLIATQKSGVVHALDPDRGGKLLWKREIASGGVLGGIEWGPATDGEKVYVAIADIDWNSEDLLDPALTPDPKAGGGLVALRLRDGETAWEAPAVVCGDRPNCSPAQTAAVTAIPGVVFSGSISGELRAFDSETGKVIWHYDTVRDYETTNGAAGRGGALDATGPVVVDGTVYVTSGYSKWGGLPGNVLLAFDPKP
jgi:polyvinyl alcohol dehydrogenase (cytochrome)